MKTYNMLIGGQLVPSRSGELTESINPATLEPLGLVPEGNEDDARAAVDAAHEAYPAWRALAPRERAARARALAAVLRDASSELAELESRDTGSPVTPMSKDVEAAAGRLEFFAGLVTEIKGTTVPASNEGFHYTVREPFGVVVRIVPFNHPIMFAASRVAAPLVAGNTVVLKVPPQAPLTGLRLGELAKDIFPPGVLNIINGDGPTVGRALVRDRRVNRVGLTGSPQTGKSIVRDSADHLAEVSLELGGKNPLIVFPDADVRQSAAGAVKAMNFGWQGQSCGSASRVFVHESIVEAFCEGVVEQIGKIRQGDPSDPDTTMGAMISQAQYDRVIRYISTGVEEGARLLVGGGRPDGPAFEKGLFIAPTVFVDVEPDMTIAREEIFGPVMSILTWSDEDEVIAQANGLDYGLTANLYTNDLARAMRLIPRLEAGFVWVNGSGEHFQGLPFGGYKDSGLGREESIEELLSYTQIKSVSILPPDRWLARSES
jgi:betaine-aldehyde dehydrogenase